MPDMSVPDQILDGLNHAQREAVLAASGPVAILAGAGTGKTRVISRRAAYAIATGVVPAGEILLVTFTDKAASEMVERLRLLHQPAVTARTFHAHALSQLRHFWPASHDGQAPPAILDSKFPIISRIVRGLSGNHRYTPSKDLAGEIEWAKSRRIRPETYVADAAAAGREPPIAGGLMAQVFADYERIKTQAGRIDFEDMLVSTVELLETDPEAAAVVRARKRWFSVDEYQDTNPLQERLLSLWAGDSRDICVVGDEDQTIYSFTGASSAYLRNFEKTHPGTTVVNLTENYRSTPEILGLANRLIAGTGRKKALSATRPSGPLPARLAYANPEAELAGLVQAVGARLAEGAVATEIAVLVRMNAQLPPIEAALTAAAIPFTVRGGRFYERPDVKAAIRALREAKVNVVGMDLPAAVEAVFRARLRYLPDGPRSGPEERERIADLGTLLAIARAFVSGWNDPAGPADSAGFLAELARRDLAERANIGGGLALSTIHRAKGLEWDAVFLPGLEEGILPIGQATGDPAAIEEERRLLYVGVTRARRYLALSWATRRPSRFLDDLGLGPTPVAPRPVVARSPSAVRPRPVDDPRFDALRTWRAERAKDDGVPAYVIAHDTTLADIAEARPGSIAELRRVKGMGPARLQRYGPEILEVLARI